MYLRRRGPAWASAAIEMAADFFFPWGTYCVACGNFIDGKRSYCICDHCIRHITWGNVEIPPDSLRENNFTGPEAAALQKEGGIPMDSVRACMKYGLYERRLIFELKYNGHTYMARILAKILADRVFSDAGAAELLTADYLIPVPVHKRKEKQRGFNQAALVAGYLSGFTGIPMLKDGLVRSESTAAQRSVAGEDRLSNLHGAFLPGCRGRLSEKISGKKVILLDDIFTTGATAICCSRVLKEAGAARVDVLAVASGNDGARGFFSQEPQDMQDPRKQTPRPPQDVREETPQPPQDLRNWRDLRN